ncbi:hypothetical protein SDC9_146139 [bioreactor metagenome]|uniref:Uncharacterized protein n=1 Tax=bioreactor metagenome TaxID=1076179 RepID=A0A645EC99_9ZZZZ
MLASKRSSPLLPRSASLSWSMARLPAAPSAWTRPVEKSSADSLVVLPAISSRQVKRASRKARPAMSSCSGWLPAAGALSSWLAGFAAASPAVRSSMLSLPSRRLTRVSASPSMPISRASTLPASSGITATATRNDSSAANSVLPSASDRLTWPALTATSGHSERLTSPPITKVRPVLTATCSTR